MYHALLDRDKTIEDCVESMKPYIDAIRFYNIEEKDMENGNEHLDRIYNEYKVTLEGIREALFDAFPDGDTRRKFEQQIYNLLFGRERNVSEQRTSETIKGLGLSQTYIIKRMSEELQNGLYE